MIGDVYETGGLYFEITSSLILPTPTSHNGGWYRYRWLTGNTAGFSDYMDADGTTMYRKVSAEEETLVRPGL